VHLSSSSLLTCRVCFAKWSNFFRAIGCRRCVSDLRKLEDSNGVCKKAATKDDCETKASEELKQTAGNSSWKRASVPDISPAKASVKQSKVGSKKGFRGIDVLWLFLGVIGGIACSVAGVLAFRAHRAKRQAAWAASAVSQLEYSHQRSTEHSSMPFSEQQPGLFKAKLPSAAPELEFSNPTFDTDKPEFQYSNAVFQGSSQQKM
jgi:hypothetical protein